MNAEAQVTDHGVVTKSAFAQLTNVSPSRVTQWIAEGKISGEALVGEGRAARIRVAVACQQLKRSLDASQRLGNGLATRLNAASLDATPLTEPSPQIPLPPIVSADPIQEQINREKLEKWQRDNRLAARAEAVSAGRLTDAAAAQQQNVRIAAQMIGIFEGVLPDMASALAASAAQAAAEHRALMQRDIVHLLRAEFRKVRAQAAATMRRVVEDLPQMIEFDLGGDESVT